MRRTNLYKSVLLSSVNKAYFAGGTTDFSGPDDTDTAEPEIYRVSYLNLSAAQDIGDLSVGRFALGGNVGTSSSGLFYGGETDTTPSNVIDELTYASEGTAVDFGDLLGSEHSCSGSSNSTKGLFWENDRGGGVFVSSYVTLASSGNASATGGGVTGLTDYSVASSSAAAGGNSTLGLAVVHDTGTTVNYAYISYASIATTTSGSDTTTFGVGYAALASLSANGFLYTIGLGVTAAGTNGIGKVSLSTFARSTTVTSTNDQRYQAGTSNGTTTGIIVGGVDTGSSALVQVSKFTVSTEAMSHNVGTLSVNRSKMAANSVTHLGLL